MVGMDSKNIDEVNSVRFSCKSDLHILHMLQVKPDVRLNLVLPRCNVRLVFYLVPM